jgi:hypothetical protein
MTDMIKKILKRKVFLSLCGALSLAACNDDTEIDLAQYESEITAPFLTTYSGTMSDDGGDVLCSYSEETYELVIDTADAMKCTSAETAKACSCTHATDGVIKLHGSFRIGPDGALVEAEGTISVAHPSYSVSDPPLELRVFFAVPEQGEYGDVISFSKDYELKIGEEITQLGWAVNHSEGESAHSWEMCVGSVDDGGTPNAGE